MKDLDGRQQRRQAGHHLGVLHQLGDLRQAAGLATEELFAQDLPPLKRNDVRSAPVHRRIRPGYADVRFDVRVDRLRAIAAAELADIGRCGARRQDHRVRAFALLHVERGDANAASAAPSSVTAGRSHDACSPIS